MVSFKRWRRHANHADLNRLLSIPNLLIFESRVCRGIPSPPAAPDRPGIRPSVPANRASMIQSFSIRVEKVGEGIGGNRNELDACALR